jgi:hypothetical protein
VVTAYRLLTLLGGHLRNEHPPVDELITSPLPDDAVADDEEGIEKFNENHDDKGLFSSGDGGGRSEKVPSLSSRRASRNSEDRSYAKDWDATNTKNGLKGLNDELLGHGGYAVISAVSDDKKEYQAAKKIQAAGEIVPSHGAIKASMTDHECHWNAAALFAAGKIDAIGTGFTLGARSGSVTQGVWFPHSWGMLKGKIVETTPGNFANTKYFGRVLTGADARKFTATMAKSDTFKENLRDAKRWKP